MGFTFLLLVLFVCFVSHDCLFVCCVPMSVPNASLSVFCLFGPVVAGREAGAFVLKILFVIVICLFVASQEDTQAAVFCLFGPVVAGGEAGGRVLPPFLLPGLYLKS